MSQDFQRHQWTDLFIRRPVLAIVVSLLILLLGLKAVGSLPVNQSASIRFVGESF